MIVYFILQITTIMGVNTRSGVCREQFNIPGANMIKKNKTKRSYNSYNEIFMLFLITNTIRYELKKNRLTWT